MSRLYRVSCYNNTVPSILFNFSPTYSPTLVPLFLFFHSKVYQSLLSVGFFPSVLCRIHVNLASYNPNRGGRMTDRQDPSLFATPFFSYMIFYFYTHTHGFIMIDGKILFYIIQRKIKIIHIIRNVFVAIIAIYSNIFGI